MTSLHLLPSLPQARRTQSTLHMHCKLFNSCARALIPSWELVFPSATRDSGPQCLPDIELPPPMAPGNVFQDTANPVVHRVCQISGRLTSAPDARSCSSRCPPPTALNASQSAFAPCPFVHRMSLPLSPPWVCLLRSPPH